MQTSVTFKNLDPSDTLKSYVTDKLNRFDRLLDNPAEANVVLSVEKFRHIAEINIAGDRLTINGKEETVDMYSAIDNVMDKIEKQIKKTNKKSESGDPAPRPKILPWKMKCLPSTMKSSARSESKISNTSPWMWKRRFCRWI